jgi:riboflavin synthase
MYTGIVQQLGTILKSEFSETFGQLSVQVNKEFTENLKIGASVSIDGVCLSMTEIRSTIKDSYFELLFDIINPTVLRSALPKRIVQDKVNIERSLVLGEENGGHDLSGHIDCVGTLGEVKRVGQNMFLEIIIPERFMRYIFPQGFIGINGCSLTISDVFKDRSSFSVWLIPETRRVTNLNDLKDGSIVNVECHKTIQAIVDTIESSIERVIKNLILLWFRRNRTFRV